MRASDLHTLSERQDPRGNRTETAPDAPLPENVWMARYKQRFIERAGLDAETVERMIASFPPFAELSDGCEDDPEYAADMEMSYW